MRSTLTPATISLILAVFLSFSYTLAQTVDTSFDPSVTGMPGISKVVRLADGKILVAGQISEFEGEEVSRIIRLTQFGDLDESFQALDFNAGAQITNMIEVHLGILVLGDFTSYGGTPCHGIIKLQDDGSLDPIFSINEGQSAIFRKFSAAIDDAGNIFLGGMKSSEGTTMLKLDERGMVDTTFQVNMSGGTHHTGTAVRDIEIVGDQLLVSGGFTEVNGNTNYTDLARINFDGSLDETFSDGGFLAELYINDIIVNDTVIYIGGRFESIENTSINHVARLSIDGELDGSFLPDINRNYLVGSIGLQSNGQLVIGRINNPGGLLQRFNTDGSQDFSFGFNIGSNYFEPRWSYRDAINEIIILPEGGLLMAGDFNSIDTFKRICLAKIDGDDEVDESFDPIITGPARVNVIQQQQDGKYIIGGSFMYVGGKSRNGIARILENGRLDTTFQIGAGFDREVRSLAIAGDSVIYLGGDFLHFDGEDRRRLARLDLSGSLDTTFVCHIGSGSAGRSVEKIVPLSEGIVFGGDFTTVNGDNREYFAKVSLEGTLDESFNANDNLTSAVNDIEIGPSNTFYVGGYEINQSTGYLKQLDEDGSPTSFSADPLAQRRVKDIEVQSDGKIIVGISNNSFPAREPVVIRLDEFGNLDEDYQFQDDILVQSIELTVAGNLVVAGREFGSNYFNNLTVLDKSAKPIPYFQTNLNNEIFDLAIADDGFIAVGNMNDNNGEKVNGPVKVLIERLERSGLVNFVIEGRVFIGLGRDASSVFSDFYEVTLENYNLKKLPTFPGVARTEAVAFVVDGKAYVGTGLDESGNNLDDFYSYDLETNSWEEISSLPGEARNMAVSFVLQDEGYVGTGKGDSGDLGDFWKYDVETGAWTEVMGFTGEARREAVAFVVSDKAYVSGGFSFDGFSAQLTDMQEYDPETGEWQEKIFADAELSFQSASAFTIKDIGFIAYGNQDYMVSYNPANNQLENLGDYLTLGSEEIGDTRADGISFALADTAYIGYGRSGFTPTIYHSDYHQFYIPNQQPSDIFLSADTIQENNENLQLIGTFSVLDSLDDRSHSYSLAYINSDLSSGNYAFTIEGNQLLANLSFNYEQQTTFNISVGVLDEGFLGYEKPFVIHVTDINEAPVFNLSEPLGLALDENPPQGDTIMHVNFAYDPDGDSIYFTVDDPSEAFAFKGDYLVINDSSLIDHELFPQYFFNIVANDGVNSVEEPIIINVINVFEAPIINGAVFEFNENNEPGDSIAYIDAWDPDGVPPSLYISNEDQFFLDDGVLYANEAFDHESVSSYTFTIRAEDAIFETEAEFSVEIQNVNEAPVLYDSAFSIFENIQSDELVGSLRFSDPENDNLTFAISEGDLDANFSISDAGELKIRFDNLNKEEYELTVTASDTEFSAEAKVSVTVLEVTAANGNVHEILLFPNPASELLHIRTEVQLSDVKVLDMAGNIVIDAFNHSAIDVSSLSAGTYILKFNTNDGIGTTRFTKE